MKKSILFVLVALVVGFVLGALMVSPDAYQSKKVEESQTMYQKLVVTYCQQFKAMQEVCANTNILAEKANVTYRCNYIAPTSTSICP